MAITKETAQDVNAREVVTDENISKVSIVGVGMRSHAGVATKMFQTLANEGINIQMISTSEIKVSVVVDAKYTELAVRVLHDAFGLSGKPMSSRTRTYNPAMQSAHVARDASCQYFSPVSI